MNMKTIETTTLTETTYDNRSSKDKWFFRGEVYYAELETGEEHEQRKKRPVVIIQNNIGNKYSPNVIVACVSSKKAERYANKPIPTQMSITLDRESVVMCEQIKTISKTRLRERVGELTSSQLVQLDDCIMKSLGLKWID